MSGVSFNPNSPADLYSANEELKQNFERNLADAGPAARMSDSVFNCADRVFGTDFGSNAMREELKNPPGTAVELTHRQNLVNLQQAGQYTLDKNPLGLMARLTEKGVNWAYDKIAGSAPSTTAKTANDE